jgi:formamidopyrimidine-DNA glycosylase
MPEGIEVRKFADILIPNLVGHELTDVNILKGRYNKKAFDGFKDLQDALPVKVVSVKCKGKFTYIELHSSKSASGGGKKFWLFNTLGLTGGWTVSGKKKEDLAVVKGQRYLKSESHEGYIFAYPVIWEYISNNNMSEWFERALEHLNVEFIIDNDKHKLRVYFYDQLSFGTLKVIETQAELDKKLRELGADMLDIGTTFEVFKKAVMKGANCKKAIGTAIVNQKIISGIGNYLRADGLWMARVNPFRKVEDLTEEELERVYKNVRALMWGDYSKDEAQKLGYIGKGFKIPHDYGREFFVYRQETDLEGHKVEKKELFEGSQKRFIYWVPEVQI